MLASIPKVAYTYMLMKNQVVWELYCFLEKNMHVTVCIFSVFIDYVSTLKHSPLRFFTLVDIANDSKARRSFLQDRVLLYGIHF